MLTLNNNYQGIFKLAACLFSPSQIQFIKPDAALLGQQLVALPFLKSAELSELITELPMYLARAERLESGISPSEWWNSNSQFLPNWSYATRKIMLLQLSSRCVECVFSLLNSKFCKNRIFPFGLYTIINSATI